MGNSRPLVADPGNLVQSRFFFEGMKQGFHESLSCGESLDPKTFWSSALAWA